MKPDSNRLENWKQIAAYLGKSISAAQRWEREEELPVHRHEHQSLSSVFAFPEELDAWLDSRRKPPSTPGMLDSPLVTEAESPKQSMSLTRRLWIGAGLAAAVAAASTAIVRRRQVPMAMQRLFHGTANNRTPSVSANGRFILYEEIDLTGIRQRLFDRSTQESRVLETFPLKSGVCESRISPNGKTIAFLRMAERNLWDVHVRDLKGGPARKIAQLDGVGLYWSPDSLTLAVTSRPEGGGAGFGLCHQSGFRQPAAHVAPTCLDLGGHRCRCFS